MKKILSIILCCFFLLSPILTITSFATETEEKSFVTFKADLTDKMIAYYSNVDIVVAKTENNELTNVYNIRVYDYNDYTNKVKLPNGTYTIISAGFTNDLNAGSFYPTSFIVGKNPNTLVTVTIEKDMSEFADITTTVVATTSTLSQSESNIDQSNVPNSTETQTTEFTTNETTTQSNIEATPITQNNTKNLIFIIIPALLIIIVVVVIIIKKRNS